MATADPDIDEALHCTEMRGVRGTSAQTRTTFWRGEYAENAGLRAEFLRHAFRSEG